MLALQQLGLRCFYKNVPCFSTVRSLTKKPVKTPEQKAAEEKKAAKKTLTHISLIHPDKTMTHMTLEDATKLSNRRNLKLIKISDYDSKRDAPVYQLMTAAQYREEALSLKKSKKSSDAKKGPYKSEKLLAINDNIGENDLENKYKQIIHWIEKNHEIRVTIAGSKDTDMAEKLFKKIETLIASQARILQKRNSDKDVKFQIVPPKQPKPANKGSTGTSEETDCRVITSD